MKTKNAVTLVLTVELELGRIDAQPMQEFLNEDVKEMKKYLTEKLTNLLKDTQNYNAVVQKVKIKN